MKRCTRCKEDKEDSCFQIRIASKDGLTAACKKCLSIYDKSRANLEHRVAARFAYTKTKEGKEAAIRSKRKFALKNAKKRSAHIKLGNAVRDKKVVKLPCEVCGNFRSHAHHDDYSKPLEVRWLCAAHHKQWHAKNGPGLNGN